MVRWPLATPSFHPLPVLVMLAGLVLAGCGDTDPAPSIIESFQVTPSVLETPGDVTARWVTSADSIELLLGDRAMDLGDRDPKRGSMSVAVGETATLQLVARRGDRVERSSQEVEVRLRGAPVIAEFNVPDYAEADAGGEATAILSWAGVERADRLNLLSEGREPIELEGAEGSVEVRVDTETSFTLLATNEVGEASLSGTVRIAYVPVIELFETDRSRIGSGEAAALQWATTGAAYVELWEGELRHLEEGAPEGQESISLFSDATLELRAINEVGTTAIATLAVAVGPPVFEAFFASPSALWPGESIELSWRTAGGSSLEISLGSTGETVCEVDGFAEIAQSSCVWQPSAIAADVIHLALSNLSGSSTEGFDFYVGDGPLISEFQASPEALTEDDPLEISWTVFADPSGNEPTISLQDDRGKSYPIPAGSTGTYITTELERGTYELRLEATTNDPRSSLNHAAVVVEVHPRPTVDLQMNPEVFDDTLFDEVTLSWTVQDAETLILYRMDDGAPVQVLELFGADREAGSYSFVPTQSERYRLLASNGIGGQAMAEVTTSLAPTEVASLVATPTSFAQGQEVHLSWTTRMADEVRLDFATEHYLLEELEAPFLDLPSLGHERVPLSGACGAIDTRGCAEIRFPDEFLFPFGGFPYNRVWVHTPGYLSFGPTSAPESAPTNAPFPTTEPSHATVSLAPFWDSLAWDAAQHPAGNVFAALLEEDGERIFVIQWSDVGYVQHPAASFNFEVVLRENGSFEYRYGRQHAGGTPLDPPLIAGSSATIGFQLPDQSDHGLLLFNGAGSINGARAHRTFSYRPLSPLPLQGELVFRPLGPQTNFPITLTATRGEASHSLSRTLTVARKPILELEPSLIDSVGMSEEFFIGWRSSHAESVAVLDADGETRCTASSKDQVEEGICSLSEDAGGTYEYTVRATGAFGSVSERTISVKVFGEFGVVSFTSNATSVDRGASVLLRWETFATTSVKLLADGVEIHSDESGALFGTYLVANIQADTEFTLVVTNDVGATEEAILKVGLWPVVFNLNTSATKVRPGDEVSINFDARSLSGEQPQRVYGILPLTESSQPGDRFVDISEHPQVETLSRTNVNSIELPFAFPYMGETYEKAHVVLAGYLSFTTSTVSQTGVNNIFPDTTRHGINVHLAPFWDSLNHRNVGNIHTALIDADTFVIQWTRFSLTSGSSNAAPQNLNFQIVLHRDGSFEYRYGAMEPHPTHRAPISQCNPSSCINEVNGSAATIGYQAIGAAGYHTFHFGGQLPGPASAPFPGGLSDRTFRYSIVEGAGSFQFRPSWSDTLSLCVDFSAETYCKEIDIEIDFGFDMVSLSHAEVGAGESATLSWETTGGQMLRVLDGGSEIFSTADPREIEAGSLVLRPTMTTTYEIELSGGGRRALAQRIIEVERFWVSASAGSSSRPGDPVTVSWNLGSSSKGLDVHLATPMEEISNEDFATYDISDDTDAVVLIGAGQNNQSARLSFQDGFTFPYFGTTHEFVQVGTDGYLSWTTGNSTPTNVEFPVLSGTGVNVGIAPFWDDLHTRGSGRVLAKRLDADRYVIQWSRMSLMTGSTNTNEGNLNFLVVLHRDGSFEFRYGFMVPPSAGEAAPQRCNPLSCENEARGSAATIGYQLPSRFIGYTHHFGGTTPGAGNPIVAGGLEFRAWRFTPQTTAGAGSAVVHPAAPTRYTICAYEATSGEVRCAPTTLVDVPWGIDLFEVNPSAPARGQPVTLSWSVQGMDALRILADEVEILSQVGSGLQPLGNFTHTPSGTTTYTLEATSLMRTTRETRVAHERTFELSLAGPTGAYKAGERVNVQWELKQLTAADAVMITPMTELEIGASGENAFLDLSEIKEAEEITLGGSFPPKGFAEVKLPFSFPYLGTPQTGVMIYADGYLSFAGGQSISFGNNGPLPDDRLNQSGVHMAVFWDDLTVRGGDSVWAYSPDPDTMILQWKGFSRTQGSSSSVRYDLNFQVVLRADGSFDYRYGTMAPLSTPVAGAGCRTEDCSFEANGASATIGYQTTDNRFGSVLHLGTRFEPSEKDKGGGDGVIEVFPFPGGLSNRSFRYAPSLSGTARLVVGQTRDHEVCAIVGGFSECHSVLVRAAANPGDLAITEIMIAPSIGAPGQWFEVRNLTKAPIDLEGFELRSRGGNHRIQSPLVVAAGGLVTLASSSQVPFTPDYVYGGELTFDRLIDRLELASGEATIYALSWGFGWNVPRNQTLSLDPSHHLTGISEGPGIEGWCPSGPFGSPGSVGESCLNPWYDVDPASNQPFIDIASSGDRFHEIEGTSRVARLPSPGFQINLFGENHGRVWAATNGWLSFSDQLPTQYPFSEAPVSVPRPAGSENMVRNPLFAGFWDRLYCHDSCRVYQDVREVSGEKVLILQWEDFYMSDDPNGATGFEGSVSFQLQLWEQGDFAVVFGTVDNPYPIGSALWAVYEGASSASFLEGTTLAEAAKGYLRFPTGLHQRAIYYRLK